MDHKWKVNVTGADDTNGTLITQAGNEVGSRCTHFAIKSPRTGNVIFLDKDPLRDKFTKIFDEFIQGCNATGCEQCEKGAWWVVHLSTDDLKNLFIIRHID